LQVQLSLARTAQPQASLNRPFFEAYLAAFRQAQSDFTLAGEPDINQALRIPGMFSGAAETDLDTRLEASLLATAEEALAVLNSVREREGAAIVDDLRRRCAAIAEIAARIEDLRGRALEAFQKRLANRLGELLQGAAIDPQRLAQEAAILAERSDIAEELMRLKAHTGQLGEMLAQGGEIGKRLDFLLQEMNRETNTLLSKTSGLGDLGLTITELALSAKAEIDKIREQSLNLE
jgi:uncharacterized protein (TIGR00255 family)